jgi:serine protein kinase
MTTQVGSSLLQLVSEMQDRKKFQELNWAGTFSEYLDTVGQNPKVTRNAFQRIYDMIMSYGAEEFIDAKKRLIRYRFFSDMTFDHNDAIFGLEIPLMRLVNFFKAASQGYGTEKRVLLLHGPVGSSKSTIARRLKKGLEHYSRTDDGALFTLKVGRGCVESKVLESRTEIVFCVISLPEQPRKTSGLIRPPDTQLYPKAALGD